MVFAFFGPVQRALIVSYQEKSCECISVCQWLCGEIFSLKTAKKFMEIIDTSPKPSYSIGSVERIQRVKSSRLKKSEQSRTSRFHGCSFFVLFIYFLFSSSAGDNKVTRAKTMDMASLIFFIALSSSTHQQCDHVDRLSWCVDHGHASSSSDEDHGEHESSSCVLNLRALWCQRCSR